MPSRGSERSKRYDRILSVISSILSCLRLTGTVVEVVLDNIEGPDAAEEKGTEEGGGGGPDPEQGVLRP